MNGKQKCAILKSIRRDIAKANDIPLDIPECTHKGECRGTCPRCEAEVKTLERQLEARRKRGLKVAVAGISAGVIAVTASSCDVLNDFTSFVHGNDELQGDMVVEQSEGLIAAPDSTETDDTDTVLDGEIAVTELAGDIAVDEYELQGAVPSGDYAEDTTGDGQ